jgi:hypothetical protein
VKTDIKSIREQLTKVWSVNPDELRVCIAIVDFLSNSAHETTHIDFARLLKLAKDCAVVEPDKVIDAAIYLSGPDLHLLDMKFEFVGDDDEPLSTHFSLEELSYIKRVGKFINPSTGKEEADFANKFFFFFAPSNLAKSIFGNASAR